MPVPAIPKTTSDIVRRTHDFLPDLGEWDAHEASSNHSQARHLWPIRLFVSGGALVVFGPSFIRELRDSRDVGVPVVQILGLKGILGLWLVHDLQKFFHRPARILHDFTTRDTLAAFGDEVVALLWIQLFLRLDFAWYSRQVDVTRFHIQSMYDLNRCALDETTNSLSEQWAVGTYMIFTR